MADTHTCIAPAAGNCIGNTHEGGGEERGGPVLIGDKGCQAEADAEADDDEGNVVLHQGHGCHKAGGDAQKDGKACAHAGVSRA